MPTMLDLVSGLSEKITEIEALAEVTEKEGDVFQTCSAFQKIKDEYEALDYQRKRLYAVKDKFDKFLVPAVIDKFGMDQVRIPELGRSFYPVIKYSASILDKSRGFEWLRSNGASELITETVNAGTLSSFLKDYTLGQGRDAPDDIFKFSSYYTTGSSKYTPKAR